MIYHSSTLRCGAAGALALFIPSLAGAQDDVAGLRIEYSASPQVAVIEYDLETMLEREDDTPLLRIYDDGLARVHHSRFMKLAGDFEM